MEHHVYITLCKNNRSEIFSAFARR